MGFRKVDVHRLVAEELAGKEVHFALYADNLYAEAKMLVSEQMARTIDCGQPLEDLLAHVRAAILDSAIRHGNPTAPKPK